MVFQTMNMVFVILLPATMRQIIGKMELDETLSGREKISTEIRLALDEATEKWGVRIERVEVVDINPPKDVQASMEKQMKAERNKRAIILEAGNKTR